MDKTIEKIKNTIENTIFEGKTYIAGGYVRDMVMGLPSKDIDIVVELENGGIELAKFLSEKLNGTSVVIFERFGTAQTVIDNVDLEFVMTRKEEYSEGSRKPEVCLGTIADDCARRDLTINSLLYNITSGDIIDLYGGKIDIENKIIRTTSNPEFIFSEDPLRLMRTVRFSTKYNFEIESETNKCLKRYSDKLSNISSERIHDEFMKILSLNNFQIGLEKLIESNLIEHIGLPELSVVNGMEQNTFHSKDVLGHILDVMANIKRTPLHRLAALLHDIGKANTKTIDDKGVVHFYGHEIESNDICVRFMRKLKFPNDEIELVSTAVKNHMRLTSGIGDNKLRKLRSEIGDENFGFLLDLCEADRLSHTDGDISHIERAREIKFNEKNITPSNLIINGDEIMEIFELKQGKEVGEALKYVSNQMCENPEISKEEVIKKLTVLLK